MDAIYARVSTDHQAEHGYSLDTQLEACRKEANKLGATEIIEFVDDGYSGEFIDRPAMNNLRAEIRNKTIDTVIVYDPDRLARNLSHQLIITEEIEKNGAQLKFVSVTFEKSPEGKLFYSLRGAVSEFEKAKILERSMRGKKGKLKTGKLLQDNKVFGYTWNKEKQNYDINKTEAEVVRKIYNILLTQKIGCLKIAHMLNEEGIKSPSGKYWQYNSVYRAITCEKYIGTHNGLKYYNYTPQAGKRKRKLRDENEWIQVSVPAIIDRETWDAAQLQLSENKSKSLRKTKYTYLLQNILICGKCGKKMSVYYSGGESNRYYGCRSKRGVLIDGNCGARLIRVEKLDIIVWNTLLKICTNKDRLYEYIHKTNEDSLKSDKSKKIMDNLNKQENKLLRQRKTIMKWFSQQLISETEIEKELQEIKKQLNIINDSREKFKPVVQTRRTPEEIVTLFKEYNQNNVTELKKKEAICKLVEQVKVQRIDTIFNGDPELDLSIIFF